MSAAVLRQLPDWPRSDDAGQAGSRAAGDGPASGLAADLDLAARRLRTSVARPLVFTTGVFDVLHSGHVACLEHARRLGRALVVGVRSDASAQRLLEAAGPPLMPQADRVRVVGALATVSAVVLFDDDMPLQLMRALRPEIVVKVGAFDGDGECEGDGSGTAGLSGADAIDDLIAGWGGRAVVVPPPAGRSLAMGNGRPADLGGRLAAGL